MSSHHLPPPYLSCWKEEVLSFARERERECCMPISFKNKQKVDDQKKVLIHLCDGSPPYGCYWSETVRDGYLPFVLFLSFPF